MYYIKSVDGHITNTILNLKMEAIFSTIEIGNTETNSVEYQIKYKGQWLLLFNRNGNMLFKHKNIQRVFISLMGYCKEVIGYCGSHIYVLSSLEEKILHFVKSYEIKRVMDVPQINELDVVTGSIPFIFMPFKNENSIMISVFKYLIPAMNKTCSNKYVSFCDDCLSLKVMTSNVLGKYTIIIINLFFTDIEILKRTIAKYSVLG